MDVLIFYKPFLEFLLQSRKNSLRCHKFT